MTIRRSQNKRSAEPRQNQIHRRLVIDTMVNPGSSAHRHQARSKADPARPHHRMVTLAQSSPGDRSACAPQSKTATVMLGPFAARCGWPCALPAHHGLKLLSDLEVQLCDTLVELALAAILGARRQIKVFLHVAEDLDQLGLGIDHQPQSIKPRLAVPALPATRPHIGYSDPSPWQGTASRIRCTSACAE